MSEIIIIKTCSHCKQIKSLSAFYRNRSTKDRYSSWCRACRKIYSQTEKFKVTRRQYQQSEKFILSQKYYQKRYRQSEKGKARGRRFYIRHPKRVKAKYAVRYAIVTGKLSRPDSLQCRYCPKQAEQYHHPSYEPEHWLDVVPICSKCHKRIHLKLA